MPWLHHMTSPNCRNFIKFLDFYRTKKGIVYYQDSNSFLSLNKIRLTLFFGLLGYISQIKG